MGPGIIPTDRVRMPYDIELQVDDHPLLRVAAFVTTFSGPLETVPIPAGALEALWGLVDEAVE